MNVNVVQKKITTQPIGSRQKQPKIVFFGCGDFGKIVFEKLLASAFRPSILVTEPPRRAGRGLPLRRPAVELLAEQKNIPVLAPEKLTGTFIKEIAAKKPTVGVIAAYGKILPKKLLHIFPKGILNIHPSLLPKHRGPSPIQFTLLDNVETGVTIIMIDEHMDHGPILAQERVEVVDPKHVTLKTLEAKLAGIGTRLLIQVLPAWLEGKLEPRPQEHEKATFTKIIKKEDGYLNFQEPAEALERKVRAFDPWPGTYAYLNDKIFKILKADVIPENKLFEKHKILPAGTLFEDNGRLFIRCGKDALEVLEFQLEGKKPMKTPDFLHGYRRFLNTKLL